MSNLVDKIKSGKILISDGAWGTFLHKMGLKPGEAPELWNVTHRSEVLSIAKSYIFSGSDIILTNSFGGSPKKLQHYGLDDRAYELNKAAAEISREAAGIDRYVLGSIGPTGVILMMGEVSEETLYKGFIIQAEALIEGGVDAICIETISAIDEALLAIKAVQQISNIDIVCTFTFEKMVDGDYKTMMGVTIEDMVKKLTEAGGSIIGANCGNGFENMQHIVKKIREINKNIPILIHANAGMPVLINNETCFPESPEIMASMVQELIENGANIIGGCCGTTPEHIKAIADLIYSYLIDQVASLIVESVANNLHDQIKIKVKDNNWKISNRYSPGYCNWSVSEQQKLFSFFPYNFCNVQLNNSSLMKPIKSISGVIGLGKDVKYSEYLCDKCGIKDCTQKIYLSKKSSLYKH